MLEYAKRHISILASKRKHSIARKRFFIQVPLVKRYFTVNRCSSELSDYDYEKIDRCPCSYLRDDKTDIPRGIFSPWTSWQCSEDCKKDKVEFYNLKNKNALLGNLAFLLFYIFCIENTGNEKTILSSY